MIHNTRLQTIPGRFVAGPLRFLPREYFTVKEPVEKLARIRIVTG